MGAGGVSLQGRDHSGKQWGAWGISRSTTPSHATASPRKQIGGRPSRPLTPGSTTSPQPHHGSGPAAYARQGLQDRAAAALQKRMPTPSSVPYPIQPKFLARRRPDNLHPPAEQRHAQPSSVPSGGFDALYRLFCSTHRDHAPPPAFLALWITEGSSMRKQGAILPHRPW